MCKLNIFRQIPFPSQTGQPRDVEEVELLMEAYNSDLREIECDLANMKDQIEDTNDFINMHLNTIRNRLINMALFMEMGE